MTVLIVDDDPDARWLVRRTVEREGELLSVAGEASSGPSGVDRWRDLRPDIVVLDHRMPGFSGLEVSRRILAEAPGQLIVLFTAHRDEALVRQAADLGVRACIDKTDLVRLRATLLALL